MGTMLKYHCNTSVSAGALYRIRAILFQQQYDQGGICSARGRMMLTYHSEQIHINGVSQEIK